MSKRNDSDDDDDVATLWEQLQAKQRKKLQRLETATEKLQQEKETMEASMMSSNNATQANDVLTINAGGKLITAMRSTLTIPTDSMWAYMFSYVIIIFKILQTYTYCCTIMAVYILSVFLSILLQCYYYYYCLCLFGMVPPVFILHRTTADGGKNR